MIWTGRQDISNEKSKAQHRVYQCEKTCYLFFNKLREHKKICTDMYSYLHKYTLKIPKKPIEVVAWKVGGHSTTWVGGSQQVKGEFHFILFHLVRFGFFFFK